MLFGETRTVGLARTRIHIVRSVSQVPAEPVVVANLVHLAKSSVITEGVIVTFVQGNLSQDCDIIVAGAVDEQAPIKVWLHVHRAVVEGGPVVFDAVPVLPDLVKIAVSVIVEVDDAPERIGNGHGVPVGVIGGRDVVAVAILDLRAAVFVVHRSRKSQLGAVRGTHHGRARRRHVQLRIGGVG